MIITQKINTLVKGDKFKFITPKIGGGLKPKTNIWIYLRTENSYSFYTNSTNTKEFKTKSRNIVKVK